MSLLDRLFGRHRVPPPPEGAKPYPDYDEWLVQMLLDDGTWGTWRVGTDRDKALERIRARRAEHPTETFRLVCMTTVHTIEDDA